eukprot:233114-Pelagomonas_calceolata.AAC.1
MEMVYPLKTWRPVEPIYSHPASIVGWPRFLYGKRKNHNTFMINSCIESFGLCGILPHMVLFGRELTE